jgi:hypothetical protein
VKNHEFLFFKKTNKENSDKSSKLELIFQTCNPWNPKHKLIQETKFSINLMLKDEIEKKINLKNLPSKTGKIS